jgi:hypothetical protein
MVFWHHRILQASDLSCGGTRDRYDSGLDDFNETPLIVNISDPPAVDQHQRKTFRQQASVL